MVTWNTHWRTPITRPTSSPNFCFTSVCNSRKHAWSLQPAQSKLYPTLVQHWTQWLLVKDWHSWPFSFCLSLTGEHWQELMRYVQPASFSCKSNSMSCRALKKEGNVRGNCNVLLVENPAAVGMAQSRFTFLIRSSIISISGKFPRGPMSLWAYDPLGPNHCCPASDSYCTCYPWTNWSDVNRLKASNLKRRRSIAELSCSRFFSCSLHCLWSKRVLICLAQEAGENKQSDTCQHHVVLIRS